VLPAVLTLLDIHCIHGFSGIFGNRASSTLEKGDMKNLLLRLFNDADGQDLIEYALLAALVALGAVAGMQLLAGGINAKFSDVSTSLNNAS